MPDPRGAVNEVRREFWRTVHAGLGVEEAARVSGVARRTGQRWFAEAGGMPPLCLEGPATCRKLTILEREQIAHGLACRLSYRVIANGLGRHCSTITRELRETMRHRRSRRVGYDGSLAGIDWHGDWEYSPCRAQLRAENAAKRPKPTKLAQRPRLAAEVQNRLDRHDSPEQISQRLKMDFPEDQEMRVSPETIYVSLFVQGRGELRRDLHKRLRTGRATRKPRRSVGERRGKIAGMVNISDRPSEAADRAVPGHWEGDLITGTENKSAIGTLVERTSRFVLLLHLPHGHGADAVEQAMAAAMSLLPETLRKTLTWDQGVELTNHVRIAAATGLAIYFCDPHSPWQRGSNENTNGLLRQYFPKSTDLSGYHPDYLDFVAHQLNTRPRKTLGWKTPEETLREILCNPPKPPGVAMTG